MNVNALSYLHLSTTSKVSLKSSSVSPGKPTIISVVIATFGTVFLILLNNSIYSSLVYLLPINFNILEDPACNGKCT